MVLLHSLTLFAYLGYTLYHDSCSQYLLFSISISFVYYARRNLLQKGQSLGKLLRGEFPSHVLLLVWLYFFKVPYFLHYIPLVLSNTGKIYWMRKGKNIETASLVQQLILFQSQAEAFVCFYLLISTLSAAPPKILQFLTYALILKIKYRFYSPTHKAYTQIHFFFDRISRHFKFRSFYHFLYQAVSCFSNEAYSSPLNWEILY